VKKRRSRRIPRRVQVQFSAAGEDKILVGFTSNFSASGMFVGTRRPYPIGTAVRVKLLLEDPMVLDAVVMHSVRGVGAAAGLSQSGMGLRLLRPSPKLNELLGLSGSEEVPSGPAASAPIETEPEALVAPAATSAPIDSVDTAERTVPEPIPETPPSSTVSEPIATSSTSSVETPQSEASLPSANLKERLEDAERERERLEEMVVADEQEKRMLRQLVSRLEMRLTAESGLTRQAEDRAAANARKIADLEAALVQARERPRVEPPPRAVAAPRRAPNPWLLLLAGAVAGFVASALLPGPSQPETAGRVPEPASLATVTTEADGEAPGSDALLVPVAVAEFDETAVAPPDPDNVLPEANELPVKEAQESTAPPAEPVDPLVVAEETVRNWAAAWSEQRVDDYLDFYSSAFEPPDGLTRGEWNDQRRDRLTRPPWIRLEVEAIEATAATEDRVLVTFDQSYETPTYRDRVRKTLELEREGEVWKIIASRSED
jgi:hypothetical protein